MARRGWSGANFFRYAAGVATAVPVTISCWGKTSITGSAQLMVGLFTSGSAANRNAISIQITSGNVVGANTSSGTGQSQAVTSTTISADTWFHACGVFASATSRAAYLNGGGKGTETTSRVPSGIDRTSVGVGDGSSAVSPFAPAGTGDLAEVAIWDVDLTDAEVLLLSKGISPLLVRPGNLIGYWPLVGNTSPEINYLSSAAVLSMQGTVTTAAHPRVIMPRRLKTGRTFAVAAADLPFGITHVGPPGTVPAHSRQGHIKSHPLSLIGKDQFFYAPGQGPTYDYPNPRIPPRAPSLNSWTFAFDPATLALVEQGPFKNQNWSNPQLPLSVNRTWTFSLGPEALLAPFTPTFWPNPSIKAGPQADTHLSTLLTTTLADVTRPFQTPFWPTPPPRPVTVTFHWGNNLIGTLLATEPPLSAAVLPVFGTWTVKVIDVEATLKVVSSIAADASVAGFAATPLKVFASESIAPLRVRTRYTTP